MRSLAIFIKISVLGTVVVLVCLFIANNAYVAMPQQSMKCYKKSCFLVFSRNVKKGPVLRDFSTSVIFFPESVSVNELIEFRFLTVVFDTEMRIVE
jgi:hypothetical protein